MVPDGEGKTRSLRISRSLIAVFFWFGIVFLIIIVGGAVSYYYLYKKAAQYDLIASENILLREENRRIVRMAEDLERLKILERRVRKSLGVPLGIDTASTTALQQTEPLKSWAVPAPPLTVKPKFSLPVDGLISRGFAAGVFPSQIHRGIDFAVPVGTIINAAAEGWVVFNDWHFRYGTLLIVQHPGEYLTLYGHNSSVLVEVGEYVEAGQPVAVSGNTGHSTAPHLHFEIRHRGKAVNPVEVIHGLNRNSALSPVEN